MASAQPMSLPAAFHPSTILQAPLCPATMMPIIHRGIYPDVWITETIHKERPRDGWGCECCLAPQEIMYDFCQNMMLSKLIGKRDRK